MTISATYTIALNNTNIIIKDKQSSWIFIFITALQRTFIGFPLMNIYFTNCKSINLEWCCWTTLTVFSIYLYHILNDEGSALLTMTMTNEGSNKKPQNKYKAWRLLWWCHCNFEQPCLCPMTRFYCAFLTSFVITTHKSFILWLSDAWWDYFYIMHDSIMIMTKRDEWVKYITKIETWVNKTLIISHTS